MLTGIDFSSFGFGEPLYLWLLVAPAILLLLWTWQVLRRRRDARRYVRERVLPARERYAVMGDLAFWFCLIIAVSFCIVALARPQARVTVVRTGGADFVILQDGSASMYVNDVPPDRWQRSIQFVRTFAETLSWKDDRVALALFAYRAAPQVRLTRDPNALFFFLEHLGEQSPFRLEDDPTCQLRPNAQVWPRHHRGGRAVVQYRHRHLAAHAEPRRGHAPVRLRQSGMVGRQR